MEEFGADVQKVRTDVQEVGNAVQNGAEGKKVGTGVQGEETDVGGGGSYCRRAGSRDRCAEVETDVGKVGSHVQEDFSGTE